MMLHYHGTPLTPRRELLKMAGKHFCVSFANPGDADWCLAHGQSVMWDNGAFSMHTQGVEVDWAKFYEWLEPRMGPPHWAVVPDVIDGGVEQNIALIEQWPFPKGLSAVVWHLHEPIDHMFWLLERGFDKICLGSSKQYWQVGSESWCRRMDEIMNAVAKAFSYGMLPWFHGLRMLALAGSQYPLASADSVNVARNWNSGGFCPERVARQIDSAQCPIRWMSRAQQKDMFS